MRINRKSTKSIFLFLLICLISSCNPKINSATITQDNNFTQTNLPTYITAIAPTQGKPAPTIVPTIIHTQTPTPIITPTEPRLGFDLPPDCSKFDPTIESYYYADLSDGACDHPSLSPNGKYIAYSSFRKNENGEVVQEARLFSLSNSQSLPIYISKCGALLPEWSSTGVLVISDLPQDTGCGYTVIYDLDKYEIMATLDGNVSNSWRSYWSEDRNSFFTLGQEEFGPECSDKLSGYDLISSKLFPIISPKLKKANLYIVIGEPVWQSSSRELYAILRDGSCNDIENYDCVYGNSYIISINLVKSNPRISIPYFDQTLDYSYAITEDGSLEIISNPFKQVTCQDIVNEEG